MSITGVGRRDDAAGGFKAEGAVLYTRETQEMMPDATPSERGGSVKQLKWALREARKEEQGIRRQKEKSGYKSTSK